MPDQIEDTSTQSTVASLREVVAKLQTDLAAAGARVDELREARKPFAFDASQGDAGAKRKLNQLTGDERAAEGRARDLETALDEARARLKAAKRVDDEQQAESRQAEAKQLSADLLTESAAVDAAAVQLVEALRRRNKLARRIVPTGALPSAYVNRLLLPHPVDRALAFAGLHEFSDSIKRDNVGRATLRDQDAGTLSAIRRPAIEIEADDDEPEPIAEASEARHRPLIDEPAAASDADDAEFDIDDFEVNPNPAGAEQEPADAA